MRLLSTVTWQMREFVSNCSSDPAGDDCREEGETSSLDDGLPPYAILSHTWEQEEVTFRDWEERERVDIRHMKGYAKIMAFGAKAAAAGFEWIWVDTCCIDKKSSAELTEAINSMFGWYRRAKACYVYLSDLAWNAAEGHDWQRLEETLPRCRWFGRGWTLQELIAPRHVDFFASDWTRVADKDELCELLTLITGIDADILAGKGRLADVSVARRMSWASGRRTTRVEDAAYSLLGLFDVNLPLIYGEGRKAFQRLQEAIMHSTHDQSLFAWGRIVDRLSYAVDEAQHRGSRPLEWRPLEEREPLVGLFAASPRDFRHSGEIEPVDHYFAHRLNRHRSPTMVNGGVLLSLVVLRKVPSVAYWDQLAVAQPQEMDLVVLLCHLRRQSNYLIGLGLHRWGDGYYARTRELLLVRVVVSDMVFSKLIDTRHLLAPLQQSAVLRNGDILLRRRMHSVPSVGTSTPTTRGGPAWRRRWCNRILRLGELADGEEEMCFLYETGRWPEGITKGIALVLRRVARSIRTPTSLVVGIAPYMTQSGGSESGRDGEAEDISVKQMNGEPFNQPMFSHVMDMPIDKWAFEERDHPRVYVRAERMALADGEGAVDVLDLFVYWPGPLAREAREVVMGLGR